MKTLVTASLFALASLAPTLAHADDGAAPAAAVASTSSSSTVFVGGSLDFLPIGTLVGSFGGQDRSADTAAAIAVGGLVETRLNPWLAIGFAPRYLFNVKSSNDTSSATQVDLRVRVTAGAEIAPKVRAYGFVTPGYSIMFPPADAQGTSFHPNGLIVGFGGGIAYEVAPKVALTGELGYQLGFQSASVNGVDFGLKDSYLQVGLGVVAALN